MIYPTGFDSWRNYFDFTLARQFVDADMTPISQKRNVLERFGQVISLPIMKPLDFFTQNIKNPLMILALATMAIAVVTIAFYPAHLMILVTKTIPFVLKIEPWMVKFATYLTVVTTISGLGIRALGRICNQDLLRQWQNGEIYPVHLGDKLFLKQCTS